MSIVRRGNQEICERYRPRRLSELYGNEGAVNSLREVLSKAPQERQKVYLFAGSQGAGKTSISRILAMGLNCEKGDTGEPCLECECCKEGLKSNAIFINEINCSKYTTKEQMFELSNQFYDFPFLGRNNIFILDEIHKLSNSSQNLLLKNLENPPANTYFFLCTTEPEKIISTIHDRCSEFLFRPPNAEDRKNILIDVFKQQGWGDKLSRQDKITLIQSLNGMSYRKILKTVEQTVTGGIQVLKDLVSIPVVDEKSEQFEIVKNILDVTIYRPFLDEYRGITGEMLYESSVEKVQKIDNFSPESFRRIMLSSISNRLINKTNSSKNKVKELSQLHGVIEILNNPYYQADGCLAKCLMDIYKICMWLTKK